MTDFSAWLAENKGLWVRVYDEVIAPDFEKAWKKRVEEHEKEQRTNDENHRILLSHVNNEIVKNARLQEENSRLKKLLEKHSPGVLISQQSESHTADATVSVEEYRHISDSYNELNKRFQEVTQKVKYLERKNVTVMQKNKEMKENVLAWQNYCDRHLGKQKSRSNRKSETKFTNDPAKISPAIFESELLPNPPSSPMSMALKTPQSLAPQHRSSPAPMIPLAHVTFPPPTPKHDEDPENIFAPEQMIANPDQVRFEEEPPLLREDVNEQAIFGPAPDDTALFNRTGFDNLGSSQATEEECTDRVNEKNSKAALAEDNDVPQVVSARSLKRKRDQTIEYPGQKEPNVSDKNRARHVQIKHEVLSSPPLEATIAPLFRKETMDLDELGPNILLTPQRRLKRTHSIHSNVTGTLRDQRSSSAPFKAPLIKTENELEDAQLMLSSEDVEADKALESRASSEPRQTAEVPANVLRPLDPNGPHRANAETPSKRRRGEDTREQYMFNIMAESGETLPSVDRKHGRRTPNLAVAHHNQHVRASKGKPNSLTHPSPMTTPAKAAAAQAAATSSTVERPTYKPPPRLEQKNLSVREAPPGHLSGSHIDRRPVWSLAPPNERTPKARLPPGEAPVPLRKRPLSELTCHDFKPNPKYNSGYTHAFSETVRKRSDRLCLPGCTNSACCGSTFRALASAAPSLTPSQEDALLQDYLGDAYDHFGLTQMSREEREEVVLQARTRQLAKEHGKHRQAYEGRRSPPGFWRVGFPDTQEQEDDREKAAKMQQEMVKERWLEAMRHGRYIFRDE